MEPTFAQFIVERNRRPRWLFDIEASDPSDNSTRTLRFSYPDEFKTQPTDTPPSMPWKPWAGNGYSYVSPTFDVGGNYGLLEPADGGSLSLPNSRARNEELIHLDLIGREVEVRYGGACRFGELPYSEYKLVRTCSIDQPLYSPGGAELKFKSSAARLQQPLERRVLPGSDWCLEGDGSTGFVDFGDSTTAAKLLIANQMTVVGRFMIHDLGAASTLPSWGTGAGAPFDIRVTTSGEIRFYANGGSIIEQTSTFSIEAGHIYHFGISISGSGMLFRLWKFASDQAISETHAGTFTGRSVTPSDHFLVGRNAASGTAYLNGWVEELSIWSYAMTEAEIDTFRSRSLDTEELGDSRLKLYLPFEDGAGSTVTDASPSPVNGTISGTMSWRLSLGGGLDAAGVLYPNCFARGQNIPAIKLNPLWSVHLLAVNECEEITTLMEGLAPRTIETTYTDWKLFTAAVAAGSWTDGAWIALVHPCGTYVASKIPPQFPVTAFVKGDASGSGYTGLAAPVARRVVTTRGPQPYSDPDELDTDLFDLFATDTTHFPVAAGGEVDGYVSEDVTIADYLTRILGSVGLVCFERRSDAKLTLRRFTSPGSFESPEVSASFDRTHLWESPEKSVRVIETELPVADVRLAYSRNWTVFSSSDITEDARNTAMARFATEPWRYKPVHDAAAFARFPNARKLEQETYLIDPKLVQIEARRRRLLLNRKQQFLEIDVVLTESSLDVMDEVFFNLKEKDPITNLWVDTLNTSAATLSNQFAIFNVKENREQGFQTVRIWRPDEAI